MTAASDRLKVSVVVPVFNAGDYLDKCAPSLLEQTIGPDAYEVIYVNDGSTDDSEDRLARLTEQHSHARYLSQPNSGWPGKPRNVGISASTAEYIQFVDQDDELAPQALERLYAIGARNRADIVIGKVGGSMAGPDPIFRRSVEHATMADVPAIESMTGHKMFRREFLEEHQIRFPEGYWRMEDILFVTRAYTHDPRISVVADQVCYWWHRRDDGQNNSKAEFDLSDNYGRLRVIIDTLREATEPGELQDELLRRFYRVLMKRVREHAVANNPDGVWLVALPHISVVAKECFPPGVRDGLPAMQRLIGLLAEREDQQALLLLSKRIVDLNPVIQRRRVRVDRHGIFRVHIRYSLNHPDRGAGSRPLAVVDGPNGWSLDHELTEGIDEFHPLGVDDPLRGARAELLLQDLESHVWWYPPSTLTPAIEPTDDGYHRVVLSGELSIDAATAADGKPLPPATYSVWFIGHILGTKRRRLLVIPPQTAPDQARWMVSASAPLVTRFNWAGEQARLRLEVRDRQEWLAANLRRDRKVVSPSRLALPVRVPGRLPADPVPVRVAVADLTLTAELVAGPRRGHGTLRLPEDADLAPGAHPVTLAGASVPVGKVKTEDGRLVWVAPTTEPARRDTPPDPARPPRPARSRLRSLAARMSRGARNH